MNPLLVRLLFDSSMSDFCVQFDHNLICMQMFVIHMQIFPTQPVGWWHRLSNQLLTLKYLIVDQERISNINLSRKCLNCAQAYFSTTVHGRQIIGASCNLLCNLPSENDLLFQMCMKKFQSVSCSNLWLQQMLCSCLVKSEHES